MSTISVASMEKFLQAMRQTSEVILNVGGRKGEFEEFFNGKDYKTLDVNPEAHPDIVASAYEIPLPDQSVDSLFAFSLIEHLETPALFVEEAYRVLKPGGKILIKAPFIHPYHGGYNAGTYCPDYYRFTKDGLAYLFRDFNPLIEADGGFFEACKYFLPEPFHAFLTIAELLRSGNSKHEYYVWGRK